MQVLTIRVDVEGLKREPCLARPPRAPPTPSQLTEAGTRRRRPITAQQHTMRIYQDVGNEGCRPSSKLHLLSACPERSARSTHTSCAEWSAAPEGPTQRLRRESPIAGRGTIDSARTSCRPSRVTSRGRGRTPSHDAVAKTRSLDLEDGNANLARRRSGQSSNFCVCEESEGCRVSLVCA